MSTPDRNQNPNGIGFWSLVSEDFRTHGGSLFCQGFWVLFWHRYGNWRMSVRSAVLRAPLTVLYQVMEKLGEVIAGISLPYTVMVGRRVKLEHFGGMILVAEEIGDDVIIRQNTTLGIANLDELQGRPRIGDRVEIGAGAVVIGEIEIGAGTVIGANAVVTQSLPPGVTAGGVPAKILRKQDHLDNVS